MVLLLAQLSAFAQYRGGMADGAALSTISIATCSAQPPAFFAYFGGNGDTAAVGELTAASCGTAPAQFAYMGGVADGATVAELSSTVCGIPPSFFAYMGGTAEGAAVSDLIPTTCAFPPSFYAYFGGESDGASMDVIASCPITPPVSNFTGTPTAVCVGSSVTFTDTSTAAPSAWNWSFPGGTPATSIEQNPTVVYNMAGTYSVTLVATNFNGSSTITLSNYITVTAIPTILTTTPGSRCDSGTVILSATSAGTLKWYSAATGGAVLGTGLTFTTPNITATTTYFVESASGTCISARIPVIATVNATPSITGTIPNSRCDSGTVNLSATASAGTISWFAAASGGTALATGPTFTTPILNATTTYYVQTANGNCVSSRTAVVATINGTPTITATTPSSRCDSGTVMLGATASAGTLNWYNVPTGGTILGTGTAFTTPIITTTTTYYVEATTGSCTSARTAVIATANATPAVTSTTPNSRCDSGSVTLLATATTGTLRWYDVATGGSVLSTGNTFVTPSIGSSTTYYVEAANGNCISSRTPVMAAINFVAAPTGTANQTFCTAQMVGQIAVFGSDIIWYDTAVGGNVVSNATPIASGTTYYASQTVNCESQARFAVTMTFGSCLETETFSSKMLKIYPNPVADFLTISHTTPISTIEVFNMLGQIIEQKQVRSTESRIDLSRHAAGTYLVRISIDNTIKTYKIIKK